MSPASSVPPPASSKTWLGSSAQRSHSAISRAASTFGCLWPFAAIALVAALSCSPPIAAKAACLFVAAAACSAGVGVAESLDQWCCRRIVQALLDVAQVGCQAQNKRPLHRQAAQMKTLRYRVGAVRVLLQRLFSGLTHPVYRSWCRWPSRAPDQLNKPLNIATHDQIGVVAVSRSQTFAGFTMVNAAAGRSRHESRRVCKLRD